MKLYIDKENLISLMKSIAQDGFDECRRSVRENLDVQYNFSKEEIHSNPLLEGWFSRFGEGVGVKGEQYFVPENVPNVCPPRPLKEDFYNSMYGNGFTAIYLLNDDNICDLISQKYCVLIGKVGEETKVLSSLLLKNTERMLKEIISWKDFCPPLPLSDIIICDNYYFKNEYTYNKNDNEIIRTLISDRVKSPVNVIIITLKGAIDRYIDLDKKQKEIKKLLNDLIGSEESSTVTILTTYKVHARCLFTNYYRIKSDTGFYLIDNPRKNNTVEIKTHLDKHNESISQQLISDCQDIVNYAVECYGDRVSHLLKFS